MGATLKDMGRIGEEGGIPLSRGVQDTPKTNPERKFLLQIPALLLNERRLPDPPEDLPQNSLGSKECPPPEPYCFVGEAVG